MTKSIILSGLILAAALAACPVESRAEMPYLWPNRRAQAYNWHGNYVYTDYGAPTALVVPPTAQLQTNWSWGAPTAVSPRHSRPRGAPWRRGCAASAERPRSSSAILPNFSESFTGCLRQMGRFGGT